MRKLPICYGQPGKMPKTMISCGALKPISKRSQTLGLLAGGAALSAAGWASAKPLLVNQCRVAIPAGLIDSPWLQQAWAGIDPAQLWDCHVHLAGIGDGGSGIVVGPQLSSPLHPLHYAQRLFYMNAGCAHEAPGKVDQAYVARLLNLCDAMPAGFKVMLFAFERFHDGQGDAHPEHSAFYVPNAWAAKLAGDFPARFEWVASLHPYQPAAVDTLKGQKIETPADLAGHNCLHYGLREFGNEWRFQRGDEEARVRVTSNVVVNNSEVVRDLLLAGMGIGLVWNYAVDREIADGRLIPLLPDWTPVGPFGQTAYALWLPQSHLPPKIRVFVDFLVERLGETPA